ncbi:diguanylate cyclase [Bacterioplanoides sp.]|uniref:sensor domain-containing diguanylate cyclase n=1 Tax=Bacterioplanoides sp. TaxID=2066072 RepID=UPI003B5AA99E
MQLHGQDLHVIYAFIQHLRGHFLRLIKLNIITGLIFFIVAYATEWWADTLAVWPAGGLALAFLMLFGNKVWPGLWLGAFAAAFSHFSFDDYSAYWQALLIPFFAACGNTAGAVLANQLQPARFFDHQLDEELYIKTARYLAAALVLGLISAFVGISSYHFLYEPVSSGFTYAIIGWSIADVVGVIAFTPFVYLLYRLQNLTSLVSVESIGIVLLTLLVGYFITGYGYQAKLATFLQPSLLIIPLLWAVLRKPPLAVAFLNLLIFMLAWWGTSQEYGYFYNFFGQGGLTAMQVTLSFILLSIQVLELLLIQRKHELQQQNEQLEDKVRQRTRELEQAKHHAETLARTDPMTALNNRRAFFELGNQIEKIAKRHKRPFCILMLDIDHFKRINDQYGHDVGDKAIIALADCIGDTIRDSDVAARIGGEEFAIITPEASIDSGMGLARRLQQAIALLRIPSQQGEFGYSVSIGLAALEDHSDNLNRVLKRADEALYDAKNSGRDCIRYINPSPLQQVNHKD